jgi:hypothetical protein
LRIAVAAAHLPFAGGGAHLIARLQSVDVVPAAATDRASARPRTAALAASTGTNRVHEQLWTADADSVGLHERVVGTWLRHVKNLGPRAD